MVVFLLKSSEGRRSSLLGLPRGLQPLGRRRRPAGRRARALGGVCVSKSVSWTSHAHLELGLVLLLLEELANLIADLLFVIFFVRHAAGVIRFLACAPREVSAVRRSFSDLKSTG